MRRQFLSFVSVVSCAFLAAVSAVKADDAPVASGVSADGKVRADMLSLKRTEGDTVTLRFAIVNDSNRTVSTTLGNMRLIDLVGRASYEAWRYVLLMLRGCGSENDLLGGVRVGPNTKSINVKFYDAFDLIQTPITN